MENKQKFELDEESLDQVAGGASSADFSGCPFPDRSTVRNTREHCYRCCDGPGTYGTPHYEAKIVYGYNAGNNTGKVLLQCTRCNGGFYGALDASWRNPTRFDFLDWKQV